MRLTAIIPLPIQNIAYRIFCGSFKNLLLVEDFLTHRLWNRYGECEFYLFLSYFLFLLIKLFPWCSEVWGMSDYCRFKSKEFQDKGLLGRFQVTPVTFDKETTDDCVSQKRKIYDEEDVSLMRCAFLRGSYTTDSELPKTRLLKWTKENRKKMPVYNTRQEDKLFCSVVTVDGRKYGSSFW